MTIFTGRIRKQARIIIGILGCVLLASATLLGQQPRKKAPQRKPSQQQKSTPKKQGQTATKPVAQVVQKPELVIQTGHSDAVRAIALSSDGKLMASASSDKTIRLWDFQTGLMLRVLDVHSDNVTSVAFSPDGKTIASGSLDKTVKLCSVQTGRLLRSLSDHSDDVNAVAFSPDGKTIASASRDETINLWDAANGEVILTLEGLASDVRAVAFSPDGKLLASGSADKTVRLWQVEDGSPLRKLEGHSSLVRTVAFSPDGKLLASGGDDMSVRIWEVESGSAVRTLSGHSGLVTSAVFSRDGKTLVSGSQDKTVKVWNLESGKATQNLVGADAPITSVALSPDASTVAAGSSLKINLWNSGSGAWVRALEGRLSNVRAVTFSGDGKMIATASRNSVKLWDGTVGRLLQSLDGHTAEVNAVAFSPKGKALASGSGDKSIKIWDIANSKLLRTLTGHVSSVTTLAYSPDGSLLASGSLDKSVKLWNPQTGKAVRSFEGHFSLVSAVAFSADGNMIASAGADRFIKIWDANSGKALHTLEGHASEVSDVAFSPDGKMLATCSRDKTIKLWDVATGQLVRTLEGNASDVLSLAYSPDGKTLASGGYDKTLRLFDTQSGKVILALEGHSSPVGALAYSPNGKFIISGSEDATAKIWSPAAGQALSTLLTFDKRGEWLVVTPEGLFDGSPEGWKSILWRFAGNTFDVAPVEAFFSDFYSPDLLADIISGKKPKAPQSISQLDRRQPEVKLGLVGSQISADKPLASREVKVSVEVTEAPADTKYPAGSGAHDVRLFRNGSLVKVWRGDVLKSQRSARLETTISLVGGQNNLTAYAFNRDNIKSADDTLLLKGSDSLRRKGKAYILAVGVNEYANTQYNLKYAVADAREFADTLLQRQSKLGSFSRVEVIQLFDKQATRANILVALSRFAGKAAETPPGAPAALDKINRAEPEDTLIVYFAGHGTAQKARFYLIPHDLGYAGPLDRLDEAGLKTLLAHSISDRELEQAFEQIDAGALLMVIDACNSGQALESEERRRGPMNSKGLAQLAYEKGIYILTAAQAYQAALEAAELGHGYLTYALVEEGLKKAEADTMPKDETVLVREWLDYAVDRVPQMQTEALQGARGLKVVFVPGDESISDPAQRNVQRPRVFYRREGESQPLIIDKLGDKRSPARKAKGE